MQDLPNLAKKLITFQSDKNHPEEIKKCFDCIVGELKGSSLKIKKFSKNNKPSLIAGPKLKKHYQFILNGHVDVVPADYKGAFEPKIKNGRLYGRGASDMKGPLAVLIELAKDLGKNYPQVDFALMITSDEEVGGFDGVRYLLEERGYSCDCAIIPDGGRNFSLMLAEKGVLHIRIEAKGKAAHGSRPWLGDNALDKLIKIYIRLRKKIPKTSKNNRWRPTLNLGKMEGGDATNKVPDYALMQLDFRYPNKEQRSQLLSLVKKESGREKWARWKILVEGSPLINNPQNKYFKRVQKIVQRYGKRLKIKKEHGASDGRFFSKKGIPVIMFKPFCSESHINNEWIDLQTLKLYYQILKEFILSFQN